MREREGEGSGGQNVMGRGSSGSNEMRTVEKEELSTTAIRVRQRLGKRSEIKMGVWKMEAG